MQDIHRMGVMVRSGVCRDWHGRMAYGWLRTNGCCADQDDHAGSLKDWRRARSPRQGWTTVEGLTTQRMGARNGQQGEDALRSTGGCRLDRPRKGRFFVTPRPLSDECNGIEPKERFLATGWLFSTQNFTQSNTPNNRPPWVFLSMVPASTTSLPPQRVRTLNAAP